MTIIYTSYANGGPCSVPVRSFPMLGLLRPKLRPTGKTPMIHYEGAHVESCSCHGDFIRMLPLSWVAPSFAVEVGATL